MDIEFSAFAKPIEEQLNGEGYTLGDEAETIEKINKAITMCYFHVATQSQVDSMRKKLVKRISEEMTKIEEENRWEVE